MNAVDDALCRKMWYLGMFRSVRAYERLVAYITFKGYDYETEWTEMDLKERANFVRLIINHEDIHTSIHIDIDIYDDYKTESIIASWEKYLNSLFNKKEPIEKCCGTCRYFKPDTTWCSEKCGNCYSWSSWESKEEKKTEYVSLNHTMQAVVEEINRIWSANELSKPKTKEEDEEMVVTSCNRDCINCIAPNCVGNKRITTKAELNGIFGLNKDTEWSKWKTKEEKNTVEDLLYYTKREEKKMEKRCDNCRYFKLGVMEEPCVKCTLNGDVWSKWEPKEDKKMVEDLFNYAKKDVEEVNKIWEEFFGTYKPSNKPAAPKMPEIKDVIFNGPATIVKWSDGTKTVVKAQKGKNGKTEKLDPEKGLAMAICKKVYGNDGRYYDIFKRYCE